MSAGERQRLHLLCLATWTELENAVGRLTGATLRDDAKAVEEACRLAHELLDHHLAAKMESVGAMREDVKRNMSGH